MQKPLAQSEKQRILSVIFQEADGTLPDNYKFNREELHDRPDLFGHEGCDETVRLLQDKTSLKALLDGHRVRDEGKIPNGVSMNEAFYDLQDDYPEKCK